MGSIAKCLPRFHNHIFCPDGKGTALCRWLDVYDKPGHCGAWCVAEMAGDLNLPITLWPFSRSEKWKQKSKANKPTASLAKHVQSQSSPQSTMANSMWLLLYIVRQAGSKIGAETKCKQLRAAFELLEMLSSMEIPGSEAFFARQLGQNLMRGAWLSAPKLTSCKV